MNHDDEYDDKALNKCDDDNDRGMPYDLRYSQKLVYTKSVNLFQ